MGCSRNRFTVMVVAAAIFPYGVRVSWAQNHAPDPGMLRDLDLFTTNSNSAPGPDQNSMVDQIRALRAMGCLNSDVSLPQQPAVINQPLPLPDDTEEEVAP